MPALNLDDGMTQKELVEFWNRADKHPIDTARELFPAQYAGYVRATRQLGHYASNKAAAMLSRGMGDIPTAQMYENICDDIYSKLPNFAKW
jgi:hypothetical protein